ncbi:MAG: hypothetical protein WD048_00465 [Chitinophagales bacterium]
MDKALKIYLLISAVILLSITLRYLAYLYDRPNPNIPLKEVYEENPLLISAKQRASENLDTLWKYYPRYPKNTYVKYPVDTQKTLIHYEWGKLMSADTVQLEILQHSTGKKIQIPTAHMQDWLIELEGDQIKGAYTTQALFILEARINEQTAEKLDSLLSHFSDPLY